MIAPDKARELTRIARDLFVKEFEKENPEMCENIKRGIELEAANCKTGTTMTFFGESKEKVSECKKYLRYKGFETEYYSNWEIWVGWEN